MNEMLEMIIGQSGSVFWTIMTAIFTVAEAATLNLVSIWFIFGSVTALILSLIGVPHIWQVIAFLLVSALTIIGIRPVAKKWLLSKIEKTNADALIGKIAKVTEDIDNINETGSVKIDGKTWTARSITNEKIEVNRVVMICEIQGVKLIVSNIKGD